MKSAVAKTKNVIAAFDAYQSIVEASQSGTPAMAMFTGTAGLGKTTAGSWLFAKADGLLVRCLKADTLGTFLSRLAMELSGDSAGISRAARLDFIVRELAGSQKPLFIDECDYIADKTEILETIRDIYDLTGVPVILIGYSVLPSKVKRLGQLYSRISQHVEFKPADFDDLSLMAKELVTDTFIKPCLLQDLLNAAQGNFRRLHTGLDAIEKFARTNTLREIEAHQWGDKPFFPQV
ncbi:ATP-binding protein [Rheinheimera sp.]|uniref:ATP-binding protein n=1 Tax=Rheinheimera sp. TaxID=1869214 RepID=UPI00307FC7AC